MQNNINDLNFINRPILPTSFDDSMSYIEQLARVKEIVKNCIEDIQTLEDSNTTLEGSYNNVLQELQTLQTTIDNFINGYSFQDGSIPFSKLENKAVEEIREVAQNSVYDLANTVVFGIDDNGYFYISIPDSWKEVNFSTSENGELILEW